VAQFRDRFWWSLLLAVPVVGFSHMFAELFCYSEQVAVPPRKEPVSSSR